MREFSLERYCEDMAEKYQRLIEEEIETDITAGVIPKELAEKARHVARNCAVYVMEE